MIAERKTISLDERAELRDIYRYVVYSENGKVFLGYSKEQLERIIESRFAKGRLIYHRDQYGEIDGLLIWYRFRQGWEISQFQKEKDDEDGDEIFLCACFSDSDQARRVGILRLIAKEPDVLHLKMSMLRHKGGRTKAEPREFTQKMLAKMLK